MTETATIRHGARRKLSVLLATALLASVDPGGLIAEYQQAFLDDNQDLILQLQDELADLQQQ